MDKFWQAAKLRAALLTAAASVAAAGPALAQEATQTLQTFNIPSQNTASALLEFARQADAQILFSHEAASKTTAPALVGEYTRDQALGRLLMGSSLSIASDDGRTVTLAAQEEAGSTANEPERVENAANVAQGEIVIVGTNIRGLYPEASPVEIYEMEDIARSGAITTEQFIQKLPQNIGTRTPFAPGAIAQGLGSNNRESISSIDLRGLGVSTTLTLLNGRRLALSSNGQAVDVSLIPVSAIERIEVLTDGASAIYGSDAIGGVVNVVLRDSFDGAETAVSYGGVTRGDLTHGDVTQTLGADWDSGHGLVSLSASSASALETTDRDYASATGQGTLTPTDQRYNALVTLSQDLGDRVTLSGDFAYSRRDVKNTDVVVGAAFEETDRFSSRTNQYFANVGLDVDLTDLVTASFIATYSDIDVDSTLFQTFPAFGLSFATDFGNEYSGLDLTAMVSGEAFSLPAGPVRFAIGGGYMDEEFRGLRAGIATVSADLGRTTTYAFGELLIPLVGEGQAVPLINRLELSLAARYTSHEDQSEPPLTAELGSDTVPKVGLLWSPLSGLNVRGTYSESFRAPSLSELDPTTAVNTINLFTPVGGALDPWIGVQGPTSDLRAETAETYTGGFDYRPRWRRSLAVSATYFKIDYANRIESGANFGTGALAIPAAFPDFIFHPDSPDIIEEILRTTPNVFNAPGIDLTDPAAAAAEIFALPNVWVLDGRTRNLTSSILDGFDFAISDSIPAEWGGSLNLGANVTRIFSYEVRSSENAPPVSAVDVVTRPADLRARAYVGLSGAGFDSTLTVNYIDDYENPFAPGGSQEVDSWTTFDWNSTYEFGDSHNLLSGITLRLSIQNLLDEDPPLVERTSTPGLGVNDSVGFDPANANPLGRLVVVGLSKRW